MRVSAAKRSWRRFCAFVDFARWYFIGMTLGVIAGGCLSSGLHTAQYEVGPFPGTHACKADPDCDYGERCEFSGVDATPTCKKAETPW